MSSTQAPMVGFGNVTQASTADLDADLVAAASGAIMWGGTSAGAGNAQTITVPNNLIEYRDGYTFQFTAGFANTGAATLTVSTAAGVTLTPIALTDSDGTALTGGAIVVGRTYTIVVTDGALKGRLAGASGGGGAVSSVFGRTGAVVSATNDYDFTQIANASSTYRFTATANYTGANSTVLSGGHFGVLAEMAFEIPANRALYLGRVTWWLAQSGLMKVFISGVTTSPAASGSWTSPAAAQKNSLVPSPLLLVNPASVSPALATISIAFLNDDPSINQPLWAPSTIFADFYTA